MAAEQTLKPTGIVPDAVRIRDNQRRARARRKELVEDMRTKLQTYERAGVEANVQMQQVARRVALENERLRLLLRRRGVGPEEIQSFLHSFEDSDTAGTSVGDATRGTPHDNTRAHKTVLPPLSRVNGCGRKAEPPLGPAVHQPPLSGCGSLRDTMGGAESFEGSTRAACCSSTRDVDPDPSPLNVLASAIEMQGLISVDTRSSMDKTYTPEKNLDYYASSGSSQRVSDSATTSIAPPPVSPSQSSPLEMNCDIAARIIAEMHGHDDRESIRSALGCASRWDCNIKNTELFRIMESGDQFRSSIR